MTQGGRQPLFGVERLPEYYQGLRSADHGIICLCVGRSGERFSVEEAPLDGRVAGHPKRQSFQSYYGIPLFNSKGKMLGTVCHFDSMPVRVTEEVATALDDLALLIADAAFSNR